MRLYLYWLCVHAMSHVTSRGLVTGVKILSLGFKSLLIVSCTLSLDADLDSFRNDIASKIL